MILYEFEEITHWTSNGCDCCEAQEWQIYECIDTGDQCLSIEECYAYAIINQDSSINERELYDVELCELQLLCSKLGAQVNIIEDDSNV